jgi:hypothetical protein
MTATVKIILGDGPYYQCPLCKADITRAFSACYKCHVIFDWVKKDEVKRG